MPRNQKLVLTVAPRALVLLGIVSGAGAQVANDDCETAQIVTVADSPIWFDNTLADDASAPGGPICGQMTHDVWFSLSLPETSVVHVGLCGSTTLDMILERRSACTGSALIDCNDDTCELQPALGFTAQAGVVNLLRIGSRTMDHLGAAALSIQAHPVADLHHSDNCDTAWAIGEGEHWFETSTATSSAEPYTCVEAFSDVWFRYTPAKAGQASFSMCGLSTFDATLTVYTECGGLPVDCNDDGIELNCGVSPSLSLPVKAGSSYLLRIGSYTNGLTGFGRLTVGLTVPCVGDLNGDGARDAIDLSVLLASWGMPDGDVDGDGVTNGIDLGLLLTVFGVPCQ